MENMTSALLDLLRSRPDVEVPVAELATEIGRDSRTVSTTVANAIRRRGESNRASPWRHVRRVRHGVYVYDTEPRPLPHVGGDGGWQEVSWQGDRVVLRAPDGSLFVGAPLVLT